MADPNTHLPPSTFFNLQAIAIVVGGTLAATLINYPLGRVTGLFKVAWLAFIKRNTYDPIKTISELVRYTEIGRKQGLPALEQYLESIENHFFRRGLENAILEKDRDKLADFLDNELNSMADRHRNGQEIFYNMGSYAPAFGLLGTVMGLILMMSSQASTSSVMKFATETQDSMRLLLEGMGRALVTTFYGVLLSNLLFIPIAGKLKTRSEEEMHLARIIKAGILGIQAREHPLLLEEKLLTFLDLSMREQYRGAQQTV